MFSGVFRSYQDCRSPASNDGSVCECDWECHERSNYRVRAFLGDGSASVKYIYKSKDPVDAEDKAKSLLDINPEGRLLREIKDILDELHIMINIKKQQHRAFKQFRKHVEYMIAPPLSLAKEIGTARQKKITGDSDIEDDDSGTPGKAIKRIDSLERDKMEKSAKWTLEFAHDLAADLDDRVADLNNLRESAEHTEKALNELLGLKQQRASVVQARKSVQQTEETLRKGRSIMLFTIIIIIFQPLSFGATVFGMNSYEFEGGKWSFRREITYILPISVGIILTSFILAFSPFTRSLLFLLFSVSWTWLVTSTRIYNLWIQFKIDSQHLTKVRKDTVRKWKESARAEKQERNEAKQKAKDKKRMEVLRSEEEQKQRGNESVPPGTV
ncbi:hypothetical protein BKA64DRAFT_175090 [Cadophora sp. MPI-SDFR-AT-0126]|nr:hypothetical protein BKA64DRAFT_175090 [Leotiomycetes sp. MPI-SDFR-AT-0126]